MKKSAVYAIRNIASGRVYVGSTASVDRRWNAHRHNLRKGKHHSPTLQRSWDKHGADAFSFEILEKVDDVDRLLEREQHWIDELKAADPDLGFNVAPVAGTRRGVPQPSSMVEKLRAERLGIPKSVEHRIKIGDAQRGRARDEEENRKTSEGLKRYWADPERRAEQSGRRIGKPSNFLGKKHSDEAKERLRDVALSRMQDPAEVERLRDMAKVAGRASAARGKSPEEREAIKLRWSVDREKIRESMRKAWEARRAKAEAEGRPVKTGIPRSEETKAKMRAAWAHRKAAKEAACPVSSPPAQSPGPA